MTQWFCPFHSKTDTPNCIAEPKPKGIVPDIQNGYRDDCKPW